MHLGWDDVRLLIDILGIFGIVSLVLYGLFGRFIKRKFAEYVCQRPQSFHYAHSEAPPQRLIPFENWPPVSGWHRVVILDEPGDRGRITCGFLVPVSIKLAKIDTAGLSEVQLKQFNDAIKAKLPKNAIVTAWLYGHDEAGYTIAEFYQTDGESVNKCLLNSGYACSKSAAPTGTLRTET